MSYRKDNMVNRVLIKGLAPAGDVLKVPQLTIEGDRVRVFRTLFKAVDVSGIVIMLAYVGRGVANNLIATGAVEEYTG